MSELFFSKEAMEYLRKIHPHVSESMFNGLLNEYGVRIKEDIDWHPSGVTDVVCEDVLEIPEQVSDALDINYVIKFPGNIRSLYYKSESDIRVSDALKCGYENLYKQSKEKELVIPTSLIQKFGSEPGKKKPEPLLTIELEDMNSVPLVKHKGEELSLKTHVKFDWEQKTDESFGGVEFDIKHHVSSGEQGKIGHFNTIKKASTFKRSSM